MKLTNIHTRKDFLKVNEIFGNTEGGVGSKDGFANNAKLKDTYLGSLVNGIFKGIGWLWRKSKENFIINRLIARLINELLRGVILFCFANNISLKDGTTETAASDVKKNEESAISSLSGDTSATSTLSGDTAADASVSGDTKKQHIPTLLERIKMVKTKPEYAKIKIEADERIRVDIEKIRNWNKKIDKFQKTMEEGKKTPKEKLVWKTEIIRIEKENNKRKNYINLIKQALKAKAGELGIKTAAKTTGTFDVIKKDCPSDFTTNIPKELADIGVLPYDKVDTTKTAEVESQALNFLKLYVNQYGKMTPETKEKVKLIYMQYAIINAAKNIPKVGVKESINLDEFELLDEEDEFLWTDETEFLDETVEFLDADELNEESLVRNVASNLTHSAGTAKVKIDEPRAGKVGLGKSIAMKAVGASATVGNILTKRDRAKYEKEHEEEIKMDIHSVNLAEIEKTVTKMQETNSNVKSDVSSYVNPYNLKVIQLSAEELMVPTEGHEKESAQLKLKWQKEVNHVYAGFTNIMDVDKVDITKEGFRNELSTKAKPEVTKGVGGLKFQIEYNRVDEKLPIDTKHYKIDELDGKYGIFYFSFENVNYMTTMAPVKKYPGLFRITSSYTDVDKDHNTITENKIFSTKFFNSKIPGTPTKRNLYFLMKTDQKFPIGHSMNTDIFVLTEAEVTGGKINLYIQKKGVGNILVDDKLIKSFESKLYKHRIELHNVALFDTLVDLKPWFPAFNYVNSSGDFKHTDFRTSDSPQFITKNVAMSTNVHELQSFLKR